MSVLSKVRIDLGLIYLRNPEFGIVLQIHAIYKVERKPDMVLQLVEPRSLGGPRNKLWLRHLQIMLKLLRFTKHVENVCGFGQ